MTSCTYRVHARAQMYVHTHATQSLHTQVGVLTASDTVTVIGQKGLWARLEGECTPDNGCSLAQKRFLPTRMGRVQGSHMGECRKLPLERELAGASNHLQGMHILTHLHLPT